MPGGTRAQLGNVLFDQIAYLASVTYPTIAANTIASNTATLTGVLIGDYVSWSIQNPPAHLALENIYVSAANTLTLTWSSDSVGISTGTVAVVFEVMRAENASLGLSALPSTIQ